MSALISSANRGRSLEYRVLTKVRVGDGCWEWIGMKTSRGYGEYWVKEEKVRFAAHRWFYERFVGPIPAGLDIDHLCCNTLCVRPDHLEPVTRSENVRRRWERERKSAA